MRHSDENAAETDWVRASGTASDEPQPSPETGPPPAADDPSDSAAPGTAALEARATGAAELAAVPEVEPGAPAREAVQAPKARPVEELARDAATLDALVEALLFVADGPVPVARLAEALEVGSAAVESALETLAEAYRVRGLSLQRIRDRVQLTTAAGAAAQVERFLGLAATTPLSKAALETLAIIAYQQPVTRPQIDSVRGVNSDSVIKNLLTKGLIEEVGRAEGPGRPVLYTTTPEFMQHFGLASLGELPPLDNRQRTDHPDVNGEVLKG